MTYKLFIDTDVLIDFFTDRAPFASTASDLFELSESGKVQLFISAVSINNIYYVIRKFLGHSKSLDIISELLTMTELVGTTKHEIIQALQSSFSDFEDAIQHATALSIPDVHAIITRNTKDYRQSTIAAMTPMHFLEVFSNS